MENLWTLMKKFNFTEYETKVYTTLLKIGKATGYEVSKMSGVPRSKVYNVLESLYQKAIVQRSSGEPTLYSAIGVDDFIDSLRTGTMNDLTSLQRVLRKEEQTVHESNEIWNLEGYENILAKVKNLVRSAKDELFIQIWLEDVDEELLELLQEAEQRMDKYVLILFSPHHEYEIGLKRYYPHYFEHEKLEEMQSRWINVVKDNSYMMLSTIHSKDWASAVSTCFAPMVFLAKEYVKHDAYTARILELLDEKTIQLLGKEKEKVRDIF